MKFLARIISSARITLLSTVPAYQPNMAEPVTVETSLFCGYVHSSLFIAPCYRQDHSGPQRIYELKVFVVLVFICFYLLKGDVALFRPDSVVDNFLDLMTADSNDFLDLARL